MEPQHLEWSPSAEEILESFLNRSIAVWLAVFMMLSYALGVSQEIETVKAGGIHKIKFLSGLNL